ncbi:MAG: glycoside hydrolase family 88 protein [Rhizomicrobium sp.]|nr:glycoside hydrolase family 88 protein [Rhizomicrobium sp.]
MRRGVLLLSLSMLLGVVSAASAETPAAILALSEKVADWQLSHIGEPVPHQRPETFAPRDWVMGAFYVGLTALADQKPRYTAAILHAGEAQGWQLGDQLYHADHHVIGQTWIWSYEKSHDAKMIAPMRARFDAVLASPPTNSLQFADPVSGKELPCQSRWCWCDALFMAPPAWFALSRVTGDGRYAAYADSEYALTTKTLFSEEDGLFYRDTRFLGKLGLHGERIFWARGNGWVYGGLARILDILPEKAPERQRYVDLFRKMSAALVKLQKKDGYWSGSLLDPTPDTVAETSGTGFFTYGLAYGVKHGLLPEPRYRQAAERGWAALAKAVDSDGRLGYVQPIGFAPDQVTKDDTQPFGVGAFLLAGSAMAALEQKN